jgi:uncharacterized Zn-finger protein
MSVSSYLINGVHHSDCGGCGKRTADTTWFDDKLYCQGCHDNLTKPLIEAFTEDYESGDCDNEDEIICPYCGYENDDADAFDGGEPSEWNCQRCGLEFEIEVEVEYSHTFTTRRKD